VGHGEGGLLGCRRDDVDGLAAAAGTELDGSRDQSEQRVVLAPADPVTRVEVRATLADQDLAGVDPLTAEALDTEELGVAVPAVARRRRALLVCQVAACLRCVRRCLRCC